MYLDIILPAPSPRFYAYDIMSCDHGHRPFHYPRKTKTKTKNKKKKILNQEKQIKRKEKCSSPGVP